MKAPQMFQKSRLEVKSVTVPTPTCVTWTRGLFLFTLQHSWNYLPPRET